MTTELVHIRGGIDQVLGTVAREAGAVDSGGGDVRGHLALAAQHGLVDLAAPQNHQGRLREMATIISEIAGACMSTAFSLWAHRMTIEYLTTANAPWAQQAASRLRAGTALGVTGMASAFKEAAGCGSVDVTATPLEGGYELSGTLRWASNLHPDSVLVTSARTEDGDRLVVGLPLSATGVRLGEPLDLLALGSTDSSHLVLDGVRIDEAQVLTRDFEPFMAAVRPTFLVLQSAMCLGLASRCLEQVRPGLTGVNAVYAEETSGLESRLDAARSTLHELADRVGGSASPTRRELLELRLAAAQLAGAAAGLEVRTAGGQGYARRTGTSRRFREAAFIPVQSPSESQLRWELEQLA